MEPQFNDARIDAAIEAARNFTPDGIAAIRALTDIEAQVVTRVLKAAQAGKPGRPRGSRNKSKPALTAA